MLIRFFFLTLFLFPGALQAQEIDLGQGISLFHREKRTELLIPIGTTLKVVTAERTFKGNLEALDKEGLWLDGQKIPFRDVVYMAERTQWTKRVAIAIMVVGAGIASAGTVYMASASGAGFLSSGLITASGLGATALGWNYFRGGKRYYLDSDWKVRVP